MHSRELGKAAGTSPEGPTFWRSPEPADYADQRLYRLNLETLTTEDLGAIATPLPGYDFVYAIAAAPPGLGPGIVESPAVSRAGLVVLSMLLATAALWRARRLA